MKLNTSACRAWFAVMLVTQAGAAFAQQGRQEPVFPPAMHHSTTATLMSDVGKRLSTAPVITGQFEQSKTVHGFRNPLVSRGEFVMARDKGILWHTQLPFESRLAVTRDRIVSRQANGQASTVLDATGEPGLRAVTELLFAIMAADLNTLASRFDIAGALQEGGGWVLQLVPRDALLLQWLGSVELQGDAFVRRVALQEAQGDSSVLLFSAHSSTQALSDAHAQRFE